MKFHIYTRKSIFTKKGESIESQISACKEYIENHFPHIPNKQILVYKDEGFSGKNTNRPQYIEMIKSIEKEKGGYIVCYKLDRISRSISDFSSFIDKLSKKNISFISVKEHFDTSNPVGRGMMYICAVFAQMERESIAERVKDNMMFLARSGRWLGGTAPTGFSIIRTEQLILDGKSKKVSYLEPNDDIKTVKLIYKKYLELGSKHSVSKFLFEKKIKTCLGNPYTRETIKAILRNPVYCTADKDSFDFFSEQCNNVCFSEKDFYKKCGIMPFNRHHTTNNFATKPIPEWIIALGKHKGIIPGRDWVKVQKLSGSKTYKSRTRKSEALLSGMIMCKECGQPMRMRTGTKGNNDFHYVCKNKAEYGLKYCHSKNLNGQAMDNFVIKELINLDDKNLNRIIHTKKVTQLNNKIEDQIFDTKCMISKLENTKSKYINYLQRLTPQSPLLKDIELKVKTINAEIGDLSSKIYNLENQLQTAKSEKTNLEYIISALKNLKSNFDTIDFPTKKSLVRLIVKKLIWSDNRWNIIFNGG